MTLYQQIPNAKGLGSEWAKKKQKKTSGHPLLLTSQWQG